MRVPVLLLLGLALFRPAWGADFQLRWVTPTPPARAHVEVRGLSHGVIGRLRAKQYSQAQWQQILSVHSEQTNSVIDAVELPPMAGKYETGDSALTFTPFFPLQPGLNYRAVFRPDHLPTSKGKSPSITTWMQLPHPDTTPTTEVAAIYPSANSLPENLLKFYVHFSAPMSGGGIYDHIGLLDETGRPIELPFLEIDEELWDPAMTRLTLFIDPGRIKRGVRPLEEIGPALESGKRYTLAISPHWKDAQGNSLKNKFEKTFQAQAPDREAPDPRNWRLTLPSAGATAPFIIDFGEPMDHALALRLIQILSPGNKPLDGAKRLVADETRLEFTPANPWAAGRHQLALENTIEDLAGNNIGRTFEVDVFTNIQKRINRTLLKIPFEVR